MEEMNFNFVLFETPADSRGSKWATKAVLGTKILKPIVSTARINFLFRLHLRAYCC